MANTPSLVIAIVDDEAAVRRALLRLFRESGFDARAFASGEAFLNSMRTCRYDCLVLDLHMPGMMGIDVQQDIEFSRSALPTVIITAHDKPETRQKCLAAGASAYLWKPFDDKELLQAVESAIST